MRCTQLPWPEAGESFSGAAFLPARFQSLRTQVRRSLARHAALLCVLCDGLWPLPAGFTHPARCAAQAAREGRLPAEDHSRRTGGVCCKLNKAPPYPA